MDAYKVDEAADTGLEHLTLEGYVGRGAEKIEEAVATILAEAGH
jgi:hypothetical protein